MIALIAGRGPEDPTIAVVMKLTDCSSGLDSQFLFQGFPHLNKYKNTNTQIQIQKYKYTNTQIHKYKYKNTNTQIYKYTNTNTQMKKFDRRTTVRLVKLSNCRCLSFFWGDLLIRIFLSICQAHPIYK